MVMAKRHKNTELRISNVRKLAAEYYEPGNQSRCYREVWRRYVYPIYPMCYRTFLTYIGEKKAEEQQMRLFD